VSRGQVFGALCLVCLSLVVTGARAQPTLPVGTTFIVNRVADPCDVSIDEKCFGLRDAILAANANGNADHVDVIDFAIGTGPKTIHLTSPLPPITQPLEIDGTTQPGGTGAPQIEIDGSAAGSTSGFVVQASNSRITGLVINHFQSSGVVLATGSSNVVAGNYIGTDASGTQAARNNVDGVTISSSSSSNRIGGPTEADRNVISGNGRYGVYVGAEPNDIEGNYIGTNAVGAEAVANGHGLAIDTKPVIVVESPGGPAPGPSGLTDVAAISDAVEVGGPGSGVHNVISGNTGSGVVILTGTAHIHGNFIGTNASGTAALPNANGVTVSIGANLNEIGGPGAGEGNVISGNNGSGVDLESAFNNVFGNFIGTDAAGTGAVPNGGDGVRIVGLTAPDPAAPFGADSNDIGGTADGFANVIRFNGAAGVAVTRETQSNSIRGNSISSNKALGIDLGADGMTPNDPADADGGPNALQNSPQLTGFTSDCGSTPIVCTTNVVGMLSSTPTSSFPSMYSVDFYASALCDPSGFGEGGSFLGNVEVTTGADGLASFSFALPAGLLPDAVLTATATELEPSDGPPLPGSTSEFSNCLARSADLAVTKKVDPSQATVGETLTYTITIHNGGPEVAEGVTLSDPLPPGIQATSATSSRGFCTGTTTITCDIGVLPVDDSAEITIAGTISAAGTLINTATASAGTPDPDLTNNSASVTIPITSADLSIAKAHAPDPVNVGDVLTYTLLVGNAGPSTADDVRVTDTLDATTTFVSATPSQGTCSGAPALVCQLGPLPSGAKATIVVRVTPQVAGSLNNTAAVTSKTFDPNPPNNSATATTPVTRADLSLTKTAAPAPLNVGEVLAYTLTVRNAGPTAAVGVRLADAVDATTTFVSATSTQGTCSGAPALVCQLGSLAAGAQATVVMRVIPHAAGSLTNTADVTSETADPNSANNSASVIVDVTSADLSLTKTDAPDPINVADVLAYTLTVRNAGPSAAVGVRLTDTLEATTTFVSATATQGTCSGAPALVCELGSLAAGAQATVVVRVTPRAAGPLTNAATVTSQTFDPSPANNSATASTDVTSADLSIEKVDTPDPVTVGGTLAYTVSVSNAGPSPSTGVRVTDNIAGAASFVSATSTSGACTGRVVVTCDVGTLAAGARAKIQIEVKPRSAGTLANVAAVASTTYDPDLDNNSALASTRVTSADLSATVAATPRTQKVGRVVTFTVRVKNNGPTKASNTVVTLSVPDGATFTRRQRCSGRSTVRCNLGTLGVRKEVVVVITDRPKRAGRLVTTARVAGADFDPNGRNNLGSAKATARFMPRIRVSPPIGPPGFVAFVVGDGFPPASVVALKWSPGLGVATVRTSASGGLRAPMLVFPNDVVGPRVLVATGNSSDPGLKFAPVSAAFLVVPGRFLPAGFVERR
jgi:uncharacterized repeat protein (TIGR01451 family)